MNIKIVDFEGCTGKKTIEDIGLDTPMFWDFVNRLERGNRKVNLVLAVEAVQDAQWRKAIDATRASPLTDKEIQDWQECYQELCRLPDLEEVKKKYKVQMLNAATPYAENDF